MEETFDVRLHHSGQFNKNSYVCGKSMVIEQQCVDYFSYTVLMEFVKDFLHYTEIGGVYINQGKKGGWKLVLNDKDTLEAVDACRNCKEVNFYVDNIVNKDVHPLEQMQPHVIIRPRVNIIEAKKVAKRKFITTRQLQQEQQKKKINNNQQMVQTTPVLLKSREAISEMGNKNLSAKRKLNLEESWSTEEEEDNSADNFTDVQSPKLVQYEKDRMNRIQEIDNHFNALGIKALVQNLKKDPKGKEIKTLNGNEDEENDYLPEEDDELSDTQNTSKRIKTSKAHIVNQGPRTRSKVNAVNVVKEDIAKSTNIFPAIVNGAQTDVTPGNLKADMKMSTKEVTTSKKLEILKPTCTKVFKSIDGEAPGSVEAYLALRKLQENNIAYQIENEDCLESNKGATDDVVKPVGVKKLRGKTKMSKVHGRSSDEKVIITLNSHAQPIGPNANELSNFVGTLARDISLTYINWHLVPAKLKKQMWEYTLSKYIIPKEGEEWVYMTLNDTWRTYKSRIKGKYYTSYATDEERIQNRPKDIPLEDFKTMIKYWGDKEVKALAEKNVAHRKALTETHTMGPKTMAQVKDKMKNDDPNLASPSNAQLFLETRARKAGRNYKSNVESLKKRFTEIQRLLSSGQESDADIMVKGDREHGSKWLVGRRSKTAAATSTKNPITDHYVQELSAKLKCDLENELETKVNQKVQENMAWILKRLREANPGLNIDIGDYCATTSSNPEDIDTPLTQGGVNSK